MTGWRVLYTSYDRKTRRRKGARRASKIGFKLPAELVELSVVEAGPPVVGPTVGPAPLVVVVCPPMVIGPVVTTVAGPVVRASEVVALAALEVVTVAAVEAAEVAEGGG